MMTLLRRNIVLLACALLGLSGHHAAAFTYQGRLTDGAVAATGRYDLQFTLFNAAAEGSPIGGILTFPDNRLTNGLFTVALDFGSSSFDGQARWLEIAVRTNGAVSFTTLAPRVQITPTPYALQALGVVSNGIAGTYQQSVVFNNPANVFAGSFSGDGGGLTNVAVTAAAVATNVHYGGAVLTSNVMTINHDWTNANAFLGFGGLQLPMAWYGQDWVGNDNPRNGIEWWVTGWDGTPCPPTDHTTVPSAFIHVLRKWGGNDDTPTMHLASQGSIRIEDGYGVPNFGRNLYVSLGNEDANGWVIVNYAHGGSYTHTWPPTSWTIKPWFKGYGLPLVFQAETTKDSRLWYASPAIWAHGADTNAPDANMGMGELWFMSQAPTRDPYQPTIGELSPAGVVVGKMLTNGWNFRGRLILEQSLITADNGTNYFLDFNAASVSTIRLTSTLANRFLVTHQDTSTNEFEPRTYRILSGDASRPLSWPANWAVVTESGTGSLPTLLAAKKVLHLRLESWGPSESDIVARFAIGNDTSP